MPSARRGKGEGSIFKRDNRWVSELNIGYDANGKRHRRTVYGKTKREVQDKLTKLHTEQAAGILTEPTRLTLAQYMQTWLETAVKPSVRLSTYIGYASIIRNHINPALGGLPLAKVTPMHVQHFYSSMAHTRSFKEGKAIAPRMRQLAHAVLNKALGQAVKWGNLSRNPCDAVDRPKVEKKTMQYLNPDEARRLLDASKGDRLHALYVLAILTGLRQGELLALQWRDIDADNSTLAVTKTLLEHNGQFQLGEPKSSKGKRLIKLPTVAMEALYEHKTKMGQEANPSTFVFSDETGKPISKSFLRRRSFNPLLKLAGLPQIRFHDLRHTAATLLLTQGVHPKVAQERLGHSTINLTLDTYSHVIPSLQEDAAAKLDNLFLT